MPNPNPSPATRFKPGQSGNPSGRSSEELKNLNKAARISSELTLKALSCLQERVNAEGHDKLTDDQIIAMLLNKDTRGMIIEAQNRAHGTPKQAVDHTSSDGTMSPKEVTPEVVNALVDKLTE